MDQDPHNRYNLIDELFKLIKDYGTRSRLVTPDPDAVEEQNEVDPAHFPGVVPVYPVDLLPPENEGLDQDEMPISIDVGFGVLSQDDIPSLPEQPVVDIQEPLAVEGSFVVEESVFVEGSVVFADEILSEEPIAADPLSNEDDADVYDLVD